MAHITDTFTQGGQTQLHKFRMLSQVFGTTLKVSLLVSFAFFIVLLFWSHSWEHFAFLGAYYKAVWRDHMSFLPVGFFDSSWVCHKGGHWYEVNDYILAKHPNYKRSAFIAEAFFLRTILHTLLFFVSSFISVCGFWLWRGKAMKEKEILSGTVEVTKNS